MVIQDLESSPPPKRRLPSAGDVQGKGVCVVCGVCVCVCGGGGGGGAHLVYNDILVCYTHCTVWTVHNPLPQVI